MTIEELESVVKIAERHNFRSIYMQGIKDALSTIIHCKDCKFNYANQIPSDDVCQLCVELPISKDFFCAYGEKMDEETI